MEALYKLRARPGAQGSAAAWDAALECGVQRLEDCARFLSGLPLRYLRPIARAEGRSQALRLFAPGHCVKCVRHPPSSSGSEAGRYRPTGRATQTYKPDNALLRFLLQHRLPQRYGVHNLGHTIRSGHPVYESIRRQVLEEQRRKRAANEQAVFDSIDRKLALIRERGEARKGDES